MTEKNPSQKPAEQKRDPDLVNAEIAIKRAAKRAREFARRTGTSVVIYENGVIREERETTITHQNQ